LRESSIEREREFDLHLLFLYLPLHCCSNDLFGVLFSFDPLLRPCPDDEFLPAVFLCSEYFSSSSDLLKEVTKVFIRTESQDDTEWRQFVARRFCTLLVTWVECSEAQLRQDKKFCRAITEVCVYASGCGCV
jgi:hypothetical protein